MQIGSYFGPPFSYWLNCNGCEREESWANLEINCDMSRCYLICAHNIHGGTLNGGARLQFSF